MEKFLPRNHFISGISLIEVLVSLAILATIGIVTISAINPSFQQKKARDTRRRSDLEQYRVALESYSSFHDMKYPTYGSWTVISSTNLCADLTNLIDSCQLDPINANPNQYYYLSTDGVSFSLRADLEAGGYWFVCSTGKVGEAAASGGYCT